MRHYSLKLINPLKLSIVISAITFVFFLVGIISVLHLAWQENQNFVQTLSQTMIKTQLKTIESGDFRHFIEGVGQDYPRFYVSIFENENELFRFGKRSFLSACAQTKVRGLKADLTFDIHICKPLDSQLAGFVPVLIGFPLLILAIILLASRVEGHSKKALQNFMREAGLNLKDSMSFSETLNQLKFLQGEFIVLKQKMAQAAEERMRAKVSAYLAHDLRSPLLIFEEVLHVESFDRFHQLKTQMRKSLSRIHFMINGLKERNFSQISVREHSDFNLRTILNEAKILADTRNVTLHVVMEHGKTYAVDAEKIERVVANILQNAIEWAQSRVCLSMQSDLDHVYIEISDDGKGVANEFKDQIYEEHFSFGKTHGTGLGLSYAREIVRAHGGSLSHDRLEGMTVFRIRLPQVLQKGAAEVDGLMMDSCTSKPIHIVSTQGFAGDPSTTLGMAGAEVANTVLVVLDNQDLCIELKSCTQSKTWDFQKNIDENTSLDSFSIIYSDNPEQIAIAIQKGLQPIVALESDCSQKAIAKIQRILEAKV